MVYPLYPTEENKNLLRHRLFSSEKTKKKFCVNCIQYISKIVV